MRTAFLTGGTGFLGTHVARALANEGWKVRALARPGSHTGPLTAAGAELVFGDLSSSAALEKGVDACECVIHAAGLLKARTLEDYREVNVIGTENVLRAAQRRAPGAFFVLISSQAAAGPSRQGLPVAESDAPQPVSWYGQSKREGELAVERLWAGPWIAIRPAVVYGARDRGLLTMFRAAALGILPVPGGKRRIQLIEAQDAALAIARAAGRRDLAGRTPFLCNPDSVAIRELCQKLASLPPKPARLLPISDSLLRAAGALETLLETLTRRSLAFNADKAREITAGDWICDGTPLRRDLDLPAPTPLDFGLRRTWNWYRDCEWLNL